MNTNNTATFKEILVVSLKLNILLSYDPAIALLGIYPNKLKTYVHLQVNVDDSFIHISQNVGVTKRFLNC